MVRDEAGSRWLLFSSLDNRAHVSESLDLVRWKALGVCAEFPQVWSTEPRFGGSVEKPRNLGCTAESLTVMRHPLSQRWIMLANYHYVQSDDPTIFPQADVRLYDGTYQGRKTHTGFAGEMIFHQDHWYRSGVIGKRDYWELGFTEIAWDLDSAYRIVKPSVMLRE